MEAEGQRSPEVVQLQEEEVQCERMTILEYSSRSRSLWLERDGQFFVTTWSALVMCEQCKKRAAKKLKMKLRGRSEDLLFCDWKCVGLWARQHGPV
jgi:hypothetical protein